MRLVIVVFPAPVAPTKAIFSPGFAYRFISCNIILLSLYPKSTFSKTTSPRSLS